MTAPTHGFTQAGAPVHATTIDHLPTASAYQRFNKKIAVRITAGVGTMTCAYIFAAISLFGLPTALGQSLHGAGPLPVVQWIAQTFLQLVLLSVIIVGQNIQAGAADARAAKTFEDAEFIKNQVNEHTDGGLKAVIDHIDTKFPTTDIKEKS